MAVFFSDTFDEASATAITAHTPNVGGAYTHPSISSGTAGTVGAGTGRVVFPGGGVYAVENAATPGAADYTVTGSLQWDGADGRMDGLARLTGGNSGYVFFAKFDGSIAIYRYDSGTLNGPLVSGTHTGTNGFTEYSFSYSVTGSALSFTFNGTTVNTTDTTYSAAGKVGFAGREASFYGISANDTTAPAVNGSASGVTLTLTASLVAGSASASSNASAAGVTFALAAALLAGGAASGSGATVPGVTLTPAASLVAGLASGGGGATLNFQAAGMEFIARTGLALSTFAREVGVTYRVEVFANGLTLGSPILTSGVLTTDSNGKLPNLTNPLLVSGTTYRVVPVRQSDGEAGYPRRMVAA